jgi:hypothetical protein
MTFFRPWFGIGRGKDSAMTTSEDTKTFRSPRHKLLGFFMKSRDRWKAKCLDAKRKGKALTNNVAALQRSREHWKALARGHRDEAEQLRQELEQIKNSPR